MIKKNNVLITAALPYANGSIHFGHLAGVYLPADVQARFRRLCGFPTVFICGSDEYGTAILQAAELSGREPKEHVDYYHKINKNLFQRLEISFDHYSRTTCPSHAPVVQQFFSHLLKNRCVALRETDQLYSEKEKRFFADRYVMGKCPKCGFEEARGDECPKCGAIYEAVDLQDPRSKLTGSFLIRKKTEQWFLLCDLFKERLIKWVDRSPWKVGIKNFVISYVKHLQARAISRDLSWGVPLPPPNENKVFYVWFDAPIGYISSTKEWAIQKGEPQAWKEYWLEEAQYLQFIGKDNLIFHSVIFPSMIMGQDIPYKLVDHLIVSEFLHLEGKPFSKSTGWFIDLADFLDRYCVDTLRYALCVNAPETKDTEFTFKDFQMRVNQELVGKFGNFMHRVFTFIWDRMGGTVQKDPPLKKEDTKFLSEITSLVMETKQYYQNFHLRKAAKSIMELSTQANIYFDQKKPWLLLKEKGKIQELEATMYCCLTAVKFLALISFPIMPKTARKIWDLLQGSPSLEEANWDDLMKELSIFLKKMTCPPKRLFARIEDRTIKEEEDRLKSSLGKPFK